MHDNIMSFRTSYPPRKHTGIWDSSRRKSLDLTLPFSTEVGHRRIMWPSYNLGHTPVTGLLHTQNRARKRQSSREEIVKTGFYQMPSQTVIELIPSPINLTSELLTQTCISTFLWFFVFEDCYSLKPTLNENSKLFSSWSVLLQCLIHKLDTG